jgi:hypothetical protein
MHFINRSDINNMIKSGVFPGTVNWLVSDQQSTFNYNLRSRPIEAGRFSGKTLNYTLNSQGFRTREFDQILWDESLVVQGCSVVFGDGLDDSQCLSARLAELLDIPVINLGVSGASSDLILYNSVILSSLGHRPRFTVTVWPTADRITEYTAQGANCYGSWNVVYGQQIDREPGLLSRMRGAVTDYQDLIQNQHWREIYQLINSEPYHRDHTLWLNSQTVRQVCGDRSREYTWAPASAEILGCDLLTWQQGDLARDLKHPGAATQQQWAAQIARDIQGLL